MKTSLILGCTLIILVEFVKGGRFDQLVNDINNSFSQNTDFMQNEQDMAFYEALRSSLVAKVNELNQSNGPQLTVEEVFDQLNAIVIAQIPDVEGVSPVQKDQIQNMLQTSLTNIKNTMEHPVQIYQPTVVVSQPPKARTFGTINNGHQCITHFKDSPTSILYYHKGAYLLESKGNALMICITNEDGNDLQSTISNLNIMNSYNDKIEKSIYSFNNPYMPPIQLLAGDLSSNYFLYKIDASPANTPENKQWILENTRSFIEMYFIAVAKMHELSYHVCVTSSDNILMRKNHKYVFFVDFGVFKSSLDNPDCYKLAKLEGQTEPTGFEGTSRSQRYHYQEKISAYTLLEFLYKIWSNNSNELNPILYGSDNNETKVTKIKDLFKPLNFDEKYLQYILIQADIIPQNDGLTFAKRVSLFNKRLYLTQGGVSTFSTFISKKFIV